MKAIHRGHEIDVKRSRCMGGWPMLYYSIFRISDGHECTSGCTTETSTVRAYVGYMKDRIDAELAEDDPWGEKAESKFWANGEADQESGESKEIA